MCLLQFCLLQEYYRGLFREYVSTHKVLAQHYSLCALLLACWSLSVFTFDSHILERPESLKKYQILSAEYPADWKK